MSESSKTALEYWAECVVKNNNTNDSTQMSDQDKILFDRLKDQYPSTLASCLLKLMLFYKKNPHPSHNTNKNLIHVINYKFNYALNQQSKCMPPLSFHKRKIYILPHGGMGDHITMIAAIRMYSILYDSVMVGVREKYANNLRQIFSDDPTIKIHAFHWPESKSTEDPVTFLDTFRAQGYEILVPSTCCWGGQKGGKKASPGQVFYRAFYEQCDLNYDACRWQFSHINRNISVENEVFTRLNLNGVRFAFVHGDEFVEKMAKSQTNLQIVKPVGNMLDLCKVIEQATEIYVMDSSFFCLCVVLKLKAVKKIVYVRQSYHASQYKHPTRGYYNTSVDQWTVIDMESIKSSRNNKTKPRQVRNRFSVMQGIISSSTKRRQTRVETFKSISRTRSISPGRTAILRNRSRHENRRGVKFLTRNTSRFTHRKTQFKTRQIRVKTIFRKRLHNQKR